MKNSLSNWQNSLNEELVNRLTRPLRQPGMMKMAMSQRIINRCDRFLNRLPLLSQQMQRWGNTNTLSSESIPIVYAQPVALAKAQEIDNYQPIVSQNQPTTPIQRKLDSSQSLSIATVNNTIPVQNHTDLLTSNFADPTTQSLNLKTPIDKPAISSSEIPVVSPQFIVEDLPKTSQMPLPANLTNSQISISESNLNPSSQPILEVSQTIDKNYGLKTYTPHPLRASARRTLSSTGGTPAQKYHPLRENHVSSSEIPVISPQPITEDLPQTKEILSLQEFANISDESLPIIQAKLQNYSPSQSFLPIADDLNTSVSSKQTSQDDYVENENFSSQLYAIKSPNYQNQSETTRNKQTVNISPLPLISVTSSTNPSLKPYSLPLPLAKTTSSSRSISQQPNLNRNSGSNTDSSTPRTLSPTETSVSPIKTQSKVEIDVDSIASQVERKLMRKLVIESERRGKNRWH